MKRTRTLSFEQLENRLTPTVWNNPWPDGTHLTLSFVPDGTLVGGRPSTLFQMLNARGPTALWQHQILQAVQTWAVQTNLNIGVVADDGSPLGAPGQPQSDPRFGDIRVAAIPMAPDVMAITTPFDPLAGTWSGDVRLNSNYLFDLQGTGGVDFLTAMVHEVGHSFGLPDILDQSSVEYRYYQGVRTTLGASDVTAIQALYGARQGDAFEGTAGNGTFTSARALTLLQNSDGSLGIQANADVTTAQDIDYYRFTAPLNAGSFTVRLQTKGVSLLVPSVTVYDSSQRVVGSAVSTDPLGGDLLVNVPQYNPLGTYYVKVQAATTDVFGVGGYGLQVRAIPLVSGLLGAVNTTVNTVSTVLANNDLHTNDTILTASLLPPLFSQTNSRFTAAFRGSISDGWDVDFYKVQAPTPPAGTPNVLTAMVWGTQTNGLSPHLAVYDAYGQ
ncbi:MAG TPA: matrixin family metalloprotease, partial [Gemmataceae bacterium]|nr:matrixin family metalloprotease [Gemmataceae bacterium]